MFARPSFAGLARRRRSPGLAGLGAVLLLGTAACQREAPVDHVLVVVIDTLRADRLSSYGYERPTSPAGIDWLAQNGVRFERATSQSSWTAPSMVSFFTGKHLAEERIAVPASGASLPQLFLDAGWRTGAFVVNPLIHNEENGFRRGFQHFEPDADVFAVRDWIRSSGGTRTLTYVHWVDPHDPYGPAPEYHHFLGQEPLLPPELVRYWREAAQARSLAETESSLETIGEAWNGYDDDVRLADAKVQILVHALREIESLERSVVVIGSDHGEGLWTRPHYAHAQATEGQPTLLSTHKMTHGNQLYEEQVHVPLILFAPGARAGGVVREPVENVDVLPTLLELCGLARPAGLTGRSLVPLLEDPGRGTDLERPSFSRTRLVSSVRAGRWKLIQPTADGAELGLVPELYDLEADPWERANVAGEHPQRVAALSEALARNAADGLRPDTGEWELSAENEEAMRALGYIE